MIDDWLSYWSDEDVAEDDEGEGGGFGGESGVENGVDAADISESIRIDDSQLSGNTTPRMLDLLLRREQRLFRILARLNLEMQSISSHVIPMENALESAVMHGVTRWIGAVPSCAICLNDLEDDCLGGVPSVVLRYKTMTPRIPIRVLRLVAAFEGCDGAQLSACGHTFHDECLSRWLTRSRSCPLCRRHPSWPMDPLA